MVPYPQTQDQGDKVKTPTGLNGAVVLGQEYRITLPKDYNHNLRELAKFHGLSPTELATKLLVFQLDHETFRTASAMAVTAFWLHHFPFPCG